VGEEVLVTGAVIIGFQFRESIGNAIHQKIGGVKQSLDDFREPGSKCSWAVTCEGLTPSKGSEKVARCD
jgi:hypothetical protein